MKRRRGKGEKRGRQDKKKGRKEGKKDSNYKDEKRKKTKIGRYEYNKE